MLKTSGAKDKKSSQDITMPIETTPCKDEKLDDEEMHFDMLLEALNLSQGDHVLTLPEAPLFCSLDSFITDANAASKKLKEMNGPDFPHLLVFKDTSNYAQPGHVSGDSGKPDIVAAFDQYWFDSGSDNTNSHVHWSCMSLAGEDASKGKSQDKEKKSAAAYLDLLVAARPDFKAAFSLLVSKTHLVLLIGEAGSRIIEFRFYWGTSLLRKAMLAMVYRLYDPGDWADKTIQMVYDSAERSCTYKISFAKKEVLDISERRVAMDDSVSRSQTQTDVRVDQNDAGGCQSTTDPLERVWYPNFVCRYGNFSFGTRTNVFVHRTNDPPIVRGLPLGAIKIQLYRKNTRFDEISILQAIHGSGSIPGVVHLVCSEIVSHPFGDREQLRLGMEPLDEPFNKIKTPLEMLKVAYDVLEITRMLYRERNMLHRDISKANVLLVPSQGIARRHTVDLETTNSNIKLAEPTSDSGAGSQAAAGGKYTFVKRILGQSDDPGETNALLIDFNRSDLGIGKEGTSDRLRMIERLVSALNI